MKKDFTMNIEEIVGVLKESDKHDWCKAITRISWGDNPTTLDIRNLNLTKKKAGKGISLTDEEADILTEILLDNDYGSIDALIKALEKRESRLYNKSKVLYIDIDV